MLETVASVQKMHEHEVSNIMRQVLLAVNYCHGKHIVHRDLKPENILFSERNKPTSAIKVIDFGRSKILKYQQKISERAGSVILSLRKRLL